LDSEFIFLLFIRLVKKKEAGAEMASATPAVASETTPTTTTTETPPSPVAEKEAASPAVVAESKSIPYSEPEKVAAADATPKEDEDGGPGTITHMEHSLQKVEHDKVVSKARAWEESVKAKATNRSTRDEAKIAAWESTQKQKAEVKLRKAEEVLEKQKAKYLERMQNEIAAAHKSAQERRAMVEAKRGEAFLKAEETAAKIRATGIFPKKFGCFSA
jgi:hypothetical protein